MCVYICIYIYIHIHICAYLYIYICLTLPCISLDRNPGGTPGGGAAEPSISSRLSSSIVERVPAQSWVATTTDVTPLRYVYMYSTIFQ